MTSASSRNCAVSASRGSTASSPAYGVCLRQSVVRSAGRQRLFTGADDKQAGGRRHFGARWAICNDHIWMTLQTGIKIAEAMVGRDMHALLLTMWLTEVGGGALQRFISAVNATKTLMLTEAITLRPMVRRQAVVGGALIRFPHEHVVEKQHLPER